MKPGDFIIVILLVILSFLPLAIFNYQNNIQANSHPLIAVVSAHGEVVHEIELKDDNAREVFEFEDEHGHKNTIVREGQEVFIEDANCADLLCVQQGTITKVGETVVCLPNQVIVEITSEDADIQPDNEIDVTS